MPKIRVLLVEDDTAYARLVEAALATSEIEFDVHTAVRLAEAVATLDQHAFNLILLDLNLPDSAGLQTLKAIVAVSSKPIIVLTGLEDEALASRSLALGAQRFLRKTDMSRSSLLEAMRHAVSLHRKTQDQEGPDASATRVIQGLADSASEIEGVLGELDELDLDPDKARALQSAKRHLSQMRDHMSKYLDESQDS